MEANVKIDEGFPENEDASIQVNKFLEGLFGELDETGCEDFKNEENSSDTIHDKSTELLKEKSFVAGVQEEPRQAEREAVLVPYEGEMPKPVDDPNTEKTALTLAEDNASQDVLKTLEPNQQKNPSSAFLGKREL